MRTGIIMLFISLMSWMSTVSQSAAQPEIEVTGNGQMIMDGDFSPQVADDTDFGLTLDGATGISRTFTIRNTGTAPLILGPSAVTDLGAGSNNFSITQQPVQTVNVGQTTQFTVQYAVSGGGSDDDSEVTLFINSNDADEDPFRFNVEASAREAPRYSLRFLPDQITVGGVSTLRHSITNRENSPVSNLAFTNVLPAGVVIANPNGLNGQCGGTVVAVPGADTITLSSGALGNRGFCDMEIDVTSATINTYNNTSGDLSGELFGINFTVAGADDTLMVVAPLPEADLSVSLSGDPDPAVAGATVRYTAIVNNSGPDSATDVVSTMTLPAGGTLVSSSGCVEDPAGVSTCTLGTIASGSSKQYTVNVTIGAGTVGTLANMVSVATSSTDNNAANDSATTTLTILNEPEIDVLGGGNSIASGDAASVANDTDFGALDIGAAGDVHTFTIDNRAGTAALNITSITSSDSAQFAVGSVPTSVAAGAIDTFTVTFDPATTGTHTATITINNNDSDEGTYTIPVAGAGITADLTITKEFTDDPVAPGGSVNLEFTLTNNGDAATSISFQDDLSTMLAGTTVTALNPSGGFGACGPASIFIGGVGLLDLNFGALGAGASCTFSATVRIPGGAAPGSYTNTTSNVSAIIAGVPITVAGASATLNVGSAAPTINSDGGGDNAAVNVEEFQTAVTDVQTSDDIDSEGAGLTYSLTGGADQAFFSINANTGVLTFNSSLEFEFPRDADGNNVYDVQVTVTDSGGLTDEQDIAVTVTDLDADPAITITDGLTSTTPGSTIDYTSTVTNPGPGTASNVTITHNFPASLNSCNNISVTPTGGASGITLNVGSNQIQVFVATLPKDGQVVTVSQCTVAPTATGTLSVPATVSTTTTDTTPANNSATDGDTVITQTGTIVIVENTVPDSATDFRYWATGGLTPASFNLDDDADPTRSNTRTFANVLPGNYTVRQTSSRDFDTALVCQDPDSGTNLSQRTANLDLDPGETIICTYTNTQIFADLKLTVTDTPDPVVPGSQLTYTISVENLGPADATDSYTRQTLPAGFTVIPGSSTCNPDSTFDGCYFGVIPAGETRTATIVGTVDTGATGTLDASFAVRDEVDDSDETNNTAEVQTALVLAPEIEITSSVTGNIESGATESLPDFTFSDPVATVTYTIKNVGGGILNLTDTRPQIIIGGSNLPTRTVTDFTSRVIGPGETSQFTISYKPRTGNPNDFSYVLRVRNNDADESAFQFSATGRHFTPSIGVNNAVNGEGIPDGFRNISVPIGTNFGSRNITGEKSSQTYRVSNSGNLPTTLGSASVSITGPAAGDFGIVSQPPEVLQPGTFFDVTVEFDPSATGTRSAIVQINNDVPGKNPYDFAVEGSGEAVADISVTKTDGVTSVNAGGNLVYTIVVANAGPSTDPAVSLIDTFPSDLDVCSYTSVAVGGATGNTVTGAGNLAEILSMPSGSSVTYTASCTVNTSATGTLSNTATVTASVMDDDPTNNSATDNDTVVVATGTLTIVQDTVPNDAQDFAFSTTGGLTPTSFSLDDDTDGTLSSTRTFTNVPAGSYGVSQTAVAGFDTAVVCVDPDSGTTTGSTRANIDLDPGETITCTFTSTENVPPTVEILGAPTSVGGQNSFEVTFQFSETVTGFEIVDITVGNGTVLSFSIVVGDTYTAVITPTGGGDVTIDVNAAVARDLVANPNLAAAQVVVESTVVQDTVAIIGAFVESRSRLILENQPDVKRRLDRINGTDTNDGGVSGFGLSVDGGIIPLRAQLSEQQASFSYSLRNSQAKGQETRYSADTMKLLGYAGIHRTPEGPVNETQAQRVMRELDESLYSSRGIQPANDNRDDTRDSGPKAYALAANSTEELQQAPNGATEANARLEHGRDINQTSSDPTSNEVLLTLAGSKSDDYPLTGLNVADADSAEPPVEPFDIWLDGKLLRFSANGGDGSFAILHAGMDYLLTPGLLVGIGAQFDWTTFEENSGGNGEADGFGYMIGPYLTARLSDRFYVMPVLLWGNQITRFLLTALIVTTSTPNAGLVRAH